LPQTTQITHHLGADMPPMIFTAVVCLTLAQSPEIALDPLIGQTVILPDQEIEQVGEKDSFVDACLVEGDLEIGLEPLVEAHPDAAERIIRLRHKFDDDRHPAPQKRLCLSRLARPQEFLRLLHVPFEGSSDPKRSIL